MNDAGRPPQTPDLAANFAKAADDAQGQIVWGAIDTVLATTFGFTAVSCVGASPAFLLALLGTGYFGRAAWSELNSGLSVLLKMQHYFGESAASQLVQGKYESLPPRSHKPS